MMNRFWVIVSMFFVAVMGLVNGQSTGTVFDILESEKNYEGEVSIHQDDNVEYLVLQYLQTLKRRTTIPGYRINIFRDSGGAARKEALNCKAGFISKYNKYSAEYKYESPFHKVYIGDFRTKSEAVKVLEEIKHSFPNAFIRPYQINLPDIE